MKDLFSDCISFFLFLHFFLKKLFSFLELFLHLFLGPLVFLFSSFQIFSEFPCLFIFGCHSFFLFFQCFDVALIYGSVRFLLQKLISSVNFQKHEFCRFFFIFVRMIFDGQCSVIFPESRKFTIWFRLENFIGVFSNLFDQVCQTLHFIFF